MNNGAKTSFTMENIVEINGDYYFNAYLSNCILKIDSSMRTATVVKRVPWNVGSHHFFAEYGYIYNHGEKLILVPDLADNICLYDMKSDEIRYVSLPECKKNETSYLKGEVIGDNLYLIPSAADHVVKFNMENETIEIIKSKFLNEPKVLAWGATCQNENCIYFTNLFSDKVLCLNTDKKTIEEKTTGIGTGLSGIVYYDEKYWVVQKKFEKLICLNKDFRVEDVFKIEISGYDSGEWSLHKMICIDGVFYLLPRTANMFLSFSCRDKSFNEVKLIDRDLDNTLDKYSPITNIWKQNENVYYVRSKTGEIVCLDNNSAVPIPTVGVMEGTSFEGTTYESANGFDNLINFINSL